MTESMMRRSSSGRSGAGAEPPAAAAAGSGGPAAGGARLRLVSGANAGGALRLHERRLDTRRAEEECAAGPCHNRHGDPVSKANEPR